MTRQTLVDYWQVLEDFKLGVPLQYSLKGTDVWQDINMNAEFCINKGNEYRRKPEPEYVPLDNGNVPFLIHRVVREKDEPRVHFAITSTFSNGVGIRSGNYNLMELYKRFEFVDIIDDKEVYTPCGKLNDSWRTK